MTISTPSFALRYAILEDTQQICDLGSGVFTASFGHSVPPHELEAYLNEAYNPAAISKDILDPSKSVIVAAGEDGIVAGFAMLTRGTSEPCVEHLERKVELQRVYVDSRYHGKGIGKLLIERLESIARKEGFGHIWLGVWEENLKAQRVYEKGGYKRVGEHEFSTGTFVQTDHIMVKKL